MGRLNRPGVGDSKMARSRAVAKRHRTITLNTIIVAMHLCLICFPSFGEMVELVNDSRHTNHRRVASGTILKAAAGDTSEQEGVTVLADAPECAEDLKRICSPSLLQNNFAVLGCVQNHKVGY